MEITDKANQIKDIEIFIEGIETKPSNEWSTEETEKIKKYYHLFKNQKTLFNELMFYASECIGKKGCSDNAFVMIDTILRNKDKLKTIINEIAIENQDKSIDINNNTNTNNTKLQKNHNKGIKK